jgi:hypothetical protein
VTEPLGSVQAGRLIRRILAAEVDGPVVVSGHARREGLKDGLTVPDILRLLRAGFVAFAELENGTWRYRVNTGAFVVVVAFDALDESEPRIHIVTVFRR